MLWYALIPEMFRYSMSLHIQIIYLKGQLFYSDINGRYLQISSKTASPRNSSRSLWRILQREHGIVQK